MKAINDYVILLLSFLVIGRKIIMTLPLLPIPELTETAERYLTWVRPLLNADDYTNTQQCVQDFINGEGKQLQHDLQKFAKQQAQQNKSWLSDSWLDSYLSVRESLPLSTSATFRLGINLPYSGLLRLAYLIVGLAKQSADYLSEQLVPNVSPRGEALDMRQWLALRGIARVPQPQMDSYELAPMEQQARHITVFWQGQAYTLPILDAGYRLYSPMAVKNMLENIIQKKPLSNHITALSLAPAETATKIYQELSQSSQNHDNFQQLAHSLFQVHLSPTAFADDATALQELIFLANEKFWAYKPITISANLENDSYFVHLEHGSFDAGALQAIFGRAEETAQNFTTQPPVFTAENEDTQKRAKELHWQLSEAQCDTLKALQHAHHDKAKDYRVRITTVDIDSSLIPERTSIDCLMQLPMQYAQLKTFGKIRNTYEAVDVSHFLAGRTECVRPVSNESVALSKALLAETADIEGFNQAHLEHKNRIKACKNGRGVNRHLLGLQLMAKQRGIAPEIFNDQGYAALTKDFLSTSSLGDRHLVGDVAFSPTMQGGLGVSYFTNDSHKGFLYSISYHKNQSADVAVFVEALHEGTQRLMNLFKAI